LWTPFAARSATAPLHDRLAKAWRVEGAKADLIRRALVLSADQELNAASLAVRVAASTGAPLAGAALAGLATLSGPLHGGMTAQVAAFIAESRRALDARAAAQARLAQGLDVPGFGHPLFPMGDPRAKSMAAGMRYADDLMAVAIAGESVTGLSPNLEFSLVALSRTIGLPADAPYTILMVARTAGWLAHALEQRASGQAIRPKEDAEDEEAA
jgi:citrate synthase